MPETDMNTHKERAPLLAGERRRNRLGITLPEFEPAQRSPSTLLPRLAVALITIPLNGASRFVWILESARSRLRTRIENDRS
jgi:hypothetical protein